MQRLVATVVCACLLLAPGCTGLEPALIGAAASGAQTGVTLLQGGELRTYELARFEDVVAAADRSVESLGLERFKEIRSDDRLWLDLRYNGDYSMKVEILRRTDRVTSIDASVRKKKHRGMAALFLRDLFHELRDANAYLEEWRAGEDPLSAPN